STDQAYVLDLIENLQRQDLSPEEEADALGELIRTRGWTLQQVAGTIKRSLAYVSKRVRLFEDALLRDAVVDRGMPVSTAEELQAKDLTASDRAALRALFRDLVFLARASTTPRKTVFPPLPAAPASSGARVPRQRRHRS